MEPRQPLLADRGALTVELRDCREDLEGRHAAAGGTADSHVDAAGVDRMRADVVRHPALPLRVYSRPNPSRNVPGAARPVRRRAGTLGCAAVASPGCQTSFT